VLDSTSGVRWLDGHAVKARSEDLLALDEALARLWEADPRRGQVVELRYFGGLSLEETAEALSISVDRVRRDWRVARLWLLRELEGAVTREAEGVGR